MVYAPVHFSPPNNEPITEYAPPLNLATVLIKVNGYQDIKTIIADSTKAIGTDLPVIAIATPVKDIIPAPIICPIEAPIKSQNPKVRFKSLVEVNSFDIISSPIKYYFFSLSLIFFIYSSTYSF